MQDSPPPLRPQAKKPSENREKLIRAASALIGERGYAGTGTEAIVAAAGVTRGALYYQFVDKGDLFRAVCEDQVQRMALRLSDETMQRARSGEEELRIGALLLLDYFAERELAQILLVDGPSVLGFEPWRQVLEPVVLALLEHGLGHLVEVGRLDASQVAPLSRMLFGALTQAAAAIGGAADPEAARREYRQAIADLVDGIGGAAR